MNEPWFDPNMYSWIPGTLFGVLGGCLGALVGTLAPSGKAKGLVLGLWFSFMGAGLLMLALSLIAFFTGQPYGIWYGLGLPGLLSIILFPTLLPVVLKRYAEAEQRKMHSKDLA